ncbi:MAG: glycosyltransferase family 4 protein [Saprospiraceae bacterium]|nr:glycosyltransferase family 4 protein [Saprospiraceae bacterium]
MNHPTAFVIPYRFHPPRNGGHKAAWGFAAALAAQTPLMCISTTDNSAETPPFTLHRILTRRVWRYVSPVTAWRCWKLFRQESVGVCICFQPFIALLLFPVARLAGARTMVYVQNLEYRRFRSMGKPWWPLVKALEGWVYRRADQLLFISPDELPEAVQEFGLDISRCTVVPYGVAESAAPVDRDAARQILLQRHSWPAGERLLLFFGPQDYQPNREAVQRIADKLFSIFQNKIQTPFRVIVCGGGLEKVDPRLSYMGFVPDIETYIKAADVVINPVTSGGGVKTKIIEAVALGATVVSCAAGAEGVDRQACGDKLLVVADYDDEAFAEAVSEVLRRDYRPTPALFYDFYNRDRAITPLLDVLAQTNRNNKQI